MLDRISRGQATLSTLDQLLDLSANLYNLSNWGLGQTAGTPLKDILTYFRAEVEAHIRLGVCPAGVCQISEAVH
jgi:NADH:ubiquinone oxidoreductase subunit F (NADH-binding)